MSRTVTAMFDTRQEAEAAKARLQSSNIDADRVRIIDKTDDSGSSSYGSGSTSATSTDGENRGFFSSLTNMFLPDEDAHAYSEGINRGGFLLCAQVDEHEADEAVRILEDSSSVDFDSRQDEWRSQGWGGYNRDTHGSQYGQSNFSASGTPTTAGLGQQTTGTGQAIAEEHIPLVEEELRVGKREVNRGGARVRSYVREIPVHEQVTLRDEHVSVERRPVDQRLGAGELTGDMLRDREIEMTETHEEAVVAKEARVREEVVVRKTAEEHVEQIDDTVRRTEVDIDEGLTSRTGGTGTGTGTGSSAFGFGGGGTSGDRQGGLTGDRDGDGMPNAFDTTDQNRRP
jgi:uncharacterized protein (TIGR02271 family)